ncbi:MAG: type I methionyl aminopeptidase [Thermodesulfobacteriota bacterium]
MAKAVLLKTPAQIELMRQANRIVAGALMMLRQRVTPGVSTWQLDAWAEEYAQAHGAQPAFKGYHGYPASLCVSINEQVVHGIPSKRVLLRDGDLVSFDFGVRYQGLFGDAALTVAVGAVDGRRRALMQVTQEALYRGLAAARAGNRVKDISRAVQEHVEARGFSVVRQFVGHGIGVNLHEGPEVPNFVGHERSIRLQPGMVLAVEPMVNMGTHEVEVLADGWTAVTCDRMPSAHFEHSVAVTENGPVVLSLMAGETLPAPLVGP